MSPFLGTRGAGTNQAFGYSAKFRPNQVTGLTATDFGTSRAYNDGRIDLSWNAPASNGANITGYFIERSTDGSTYSTLVSNTGTTTTTYSNTGLLSNQIYYYRVSAINAVGTGLASTAANATSTTVPQAPTVSAANVGTGRAYNNGAATVTITGGATGGKAISSYTATSSPGSFTATSGSPLTVTGLASATAYTFSVTATNANGTSTATVSNSITATTVPQAPTIGTATDGGTGTTVSVAFTGNATGGSAITTYTATSSPGSITGTGASSPITVSGLTTGTAYTFTVTATNANGTSSASAASNSVTPITPTSFESIASSYTSGTNSITFNSIPQTYKHLQIRYKLVGTGATVLLMDINGSSSWAFRAIRGNGASSLTNQFFNNNEVGFTATGLDADVPAIGVIDLFDYTTSKNKTVHAINGKAGPQNTKTETGLYSLNTNQGSPFTNAITSVTIKAQTGLLLVGYVSLYGIKG